MTREQRTRSPKQELIDFLDGVIAEFGIPMNATQRLFYEWLNMAEDSLVAALYRSMWRA